MGAPGAGKGTQSEKIVEKYNIPHISTGDIFRLNIKGETELGMLAKSFMDKGQLVPDSVTNDMVKDRLSKDDVKNGFLLDGYPRTLNQAHALEENLKALGINIDLVLNIDTDKDLLIDRLTGRRICKQCGKTYHTIFNPTKVEGVCDVCGGQTYQRSDDNLESATTRLGVYETQTKPLLEFYEGSGLLKTISGNGSTDEVFALVANLIEG